MVNVRLIQDWTDSDGQHHVAGDLVNVDTVTQTRLESEGIIEGSVETDWNGPSGTDAPPDWSQWNGPSGAGENDDWNGPDGSDRY